MTQKSASLFALLVLSRDRSHAREALAETFWPDRPGSESRRVLRTELWRIRKVLTNAGWDYRKLLVEDRNSVRFAPSVPCSIDVEAFDRAVDESDGPGLDRRRARALAAGVALYRGELLAGDYNDWCINLREYYRSRFLQALERLMDHAMAESAWADAVVHGNRFLVHDPLGEHIHYNLMACYRAQGNRPAALRQFQVCKELFARELQIEPMPDTVALHRQILGDHEGGDEGAAVPRSGVQASRSPLPARPPSAGDHADSALAALREVRTWLDKTNERVGGAIEHVKRVHRGAGHDQAPDTTRRPKHK